VLVMVLAGEIGVEPLHHFGLALLRWWMVSWLVEVHFGDLSDDWVFWTFVDGGEGLICWLVV
jgi:hypothetical protein